MAKFKVTVKVSGKRDHVVIVEAATEGKAQSMAMLTYPHALRGELVAYEVSNVEG